MIAATYQHQMCTERRGGGNPVAASRARHAIDAHQFQPAESKAAVTQRLRAVATNHSRLSFELRGGRFSHRAGLLSSSRQGRPAFIRGWIGTCDDVADSVRLRAAGLRDEQIAAAMSPVLPADQATTVQAGLLKPEAKLAHSERPSKIVVAMTNRDTIEGQKIGYRGQFGAS